MRYSTALYIMIALCAVWTITGTNASPIVTTTLAETDMQDNAKKDEILFEGDIKLSKQVIINRFNFSSIPGGKEFLHELKGNISTKNDTSVSKHQKRGVGHPSTIDRWTNGIVRYRISSSISDSAAQLIRDAIDHWEDNTCLTFQCVTQGGNFIDFVNSDLGCWSYIGMQGGRQEINLQSPGCENFGVIVHEIGHAIGFWHEQSRPDRNNYVTINFANIEEDASHNFMTQTINSLGSVYDYGSIMHYSRTAFQRDDCTGDCETITVNNNAEYNRQGMPTLGQRTALSTADIDQANILYGCRRGKLQFYIRYARNLRDTDPIWNNPDPYVRVKARYSANGVTSKNTRDIGGTTNPTWNQWLNFDCRGYNYFEIQIWDEDVWFDDAMSDNELKYAEPGNHISQRHNAHGSGYLIYNYNFIIDGNECSPNPCQNGGTCVDQCASYLCNCQSGYGGTNCEHYAGSLSVYARYARNLPDEDGWWNDSDPYMEFIAVDQNGNSVRRTTSTRRGTQNPNWYQTLNFGTRAWRYLKVKVYDEDSGSDDALSNQQTITLPTYDTSRSYFTHYCHRGSAVFDYTLS